MQFHIVLHQPRIPQNTGNIGRLCFASNSILHLIHPLGFKISAKELKRAGMDYWKDLEFYEWDNFKSFLNSAITLEHFYLTTKSTLAYYKADLKNGAYLHFGREDAGLNPSLLAQYPKQTLTIPMQNNARSLNLATSVGIVLYEGIRQRDLFHL
ncbi:tRNA (cytidine(34)-2'-O)-methyltransferase [Helicobacter apodemus]|uniref:Putative tRNA (cytidine(34)-2'-O)-methyltransferase n=1 Tax=Helicobacter apodemus TaxID=135569 RepID=A0A4U8UD53_9HELI|nr:tRNA (cytidine(34)-2'-O)-methyltransferase [Helicobacter apodemus]TLE15704.1 tRNA (cytidine(34)-2'-O)-methyltransferase [Helicobacter apodemus]